jgi:hypothetical protein
MHDDRRHQISDGRELARSAALELVGQISNCALVAGEGARMQRDHIVVFLGAFEAAATLVFSVSSFLHPGDKLSWRRPSHDDRVHDPLHLTFDLTEPPFDPGAFGARFFLEPFALGVMGIDKFVDHFGVREVLAQTLDRERPDVVKIDTAPIAA